MAPNPNVPPDGQEPPAPTGPDWSAFEQAGITPEKAHEVTQAWNMYQGLNNLDTRGQYLQQIVRPEYDGQFIRQIIEPQEQQDPYAQFDPQQQYEDPQQYTQEQYEPQFDPRTFAEAIEQNITRKIFDQLGGMAQEQAIKDASQSAISKAGLPDELAEMVEFRVKAQAQIQPNRQPADLANEVAQQLAMKFSQWAAAPSGNPGPSAPPPSGPAPSLQERPKSFEDLARIAAENLRG